jgi:outer membrane protein assembly factor BamE (lipoprotein component of BamABCDE complex)
MLKKKSEQIIVSETNKNDIIKLLGPPSVTSTFDNDILFYIERKITTDKLIKLGKQFYLENNVLILEIDNRGILAKKDLIDLNDMKELKLVSAETSVDYQKQSFIYDFLSSMRQKVNDPLGKRKRD